MVRHKKIYLEYFGYGEQDMVPSEYSGLRGEHIHHLIFRSLGGPNEIWNLICLTGEEHNRAHDDPKFNDLLKRTHAEKLRLKGYAHWRKALPEMQETA